MMCVCDTLEDTCSAGVAAGYALHEVCGTLGGVYIGYMERLTAKNECASAARHTGAVRHAIVGGRWTKDSESQTNLQRREGNMTDSISYSRMGVDVCPSEQVRGGV